MTCWSNAIAAFFVCCLPAQALSQTFSISLPDQNPDSTLVANAFSEQRSQGGFGGYTQFAPSDNAAQMSQVFEIITRGTDGIALMSSGKHLLEVVIDEARNANVPLVLINQHTIQTDAPSARTFDESAGKRMGAYLCAKISKNARVLILKTSDAPREAELLQGAGSALAACADSVQPITEDEWNTVLLQGSQFEYAGVVAPTDAAALAFIGRLEQTPWFVQPPPSIVSFGGTADGLRAVQDRRLTATFSENFPKMGTEALEMLRKLHSKEPVDPFIDTGTICYDSSGTPDCN